MLTAAVVSQARRRGGLLHGVKFSKVTLAELAEVRTVAGKVFGDVRLAVLWLCSSWAGVNGRPIGWHSPHQ